MFKRKLKKAAIIAACLLFIAAASEGRSIGNYRPVLTDTTKATVDSISSDHHHFNADGICICLPELTEEQLQLAPRIQLNKQASVFVKSYLGENGYFLEKIRAKSGNSFQIIDEVFTRHGLPVELKYLAVIESKLNTQAVSGAGAVGLWQLMPVAAKQFGLKVNGKVDERKNAHRSTEAAAKCLLYLNKMFDDWLLTLAAYNSGPGRVFSAIKKSGSRNFWVLQQYLPEETRKHVKKFIAMHYFFEGHGSLATLTKAETKSHKEKVNAFLATLEPQDIEDGNMVIAR